MRGRSLRCPQVLLVSGLLKDHHTSPEWRAAAAAVFVEARGLEQELCSDRELQGALHTCLLQLEQSEAAVPPPQKQQQQQQQQQQRPAAPAEELASPAAPYTSSSLALLARSLLRHMQLESLTPASLAGSSQQHGSQTTVLSLQEQQAILSGLLAEQKVLVNRMQALLLDPAAAPHVHLDWESAAVLLEPLQANSPAAAAASAEGVTGQQDSDGGTELVLDMQLVMQLLQRHPDAAVRSEVYAAGLLQRLDGLLTLWGELAEVRRKIGRYGLGCQMHVFTHSHTVTHPCTHICSYGK